MHNGLTADVHKKRKCENENDTLENVSFHHRKQITD